jgi:hypothetical protein
VNLLIQLVLVKIKIEIVIMGSKVTEFTENRNIKEFLAEDRHLRRSVQEAAEAVYLWYCNCLKKVVEKLTVLYCFDGVAIAATF